jgi:hypothetical protein
LREAEDTPLAGEAFSFIQIPLASQPTISGSSRLAGDVDYRLWVGDTPVRQRQTLPLSWSYADASATAQSSLSGFQSPTPKLTWTLIGPDDVPRLPEATSDATTIFIVGADWPSGSYHLRLSNSKDNYDTGPLLTVANETRLFKLPTLPEGWTSVEANFADQVKLLGYVLPARRVQPGGGLPLTLYWQSLAPVPGDFIVFDKLLDEHQQVYGGYDRLPREYYSTILWAKDEIIEDGFAVPVDPAAPGGIYNLHVGLYSLATGTPVSLPLVQAGQVSDATSVVIGPIKVGGPPPGVTVTSPEPQVKLNQTLGGQISLLGYDVEQPDHNCHLSTTAGCNLLIKLYWRADVIPSADYTTFLHLRDAANQNVAQKDSPPAGGRYPTGLWDPGEIIVDEIDLPLTDVPPGRYTPVVGLYDLNSGQRLPVPNNSAAEIALEPIELP